MNRTNVIKDPTKNFNACHDFLIIVIEAHVIAAFVELDTGDFDPSRDWMKSGVERKQFLSTVASKILDKFCDFSYHRSDHTPSSDSVQEYAIQLLSSGQCMSDSGSYSRAGITI